MIEHDPGYKPPPVHEAIEDFGIATKEVCLECRRRGRFNCLYEIRVSKKEGDSYWACSYCDGAPT